MKETLEDETCRECGKSIKVAHTQPYEGEEEETGCAANVWEDDRDIFVGWICLDCAFAAAMRTKDEEGVRGMLSGGAWFDFSYV